MGAHFLEKIRSGILMTRSKRRVGSPGKYIKFVLEPSQSFVHFLSLDYISRIVSCSVTLLFRASMAEDIDVTSNDQKIFFPFSGFF